MINYKEFVTRYNYKSKAYKREIRYKIQNRELYDNKAKYKKKTRIVKDLKRFDLRSEKI